MKQKTKSVGMIAQNKKLRQELLRNVAVSCSFSSWYSHVRVKGILTLLIFKLGSASIPRWILWWRRQLPASDSHVLFVLERSRQWFLYCWYFSFRLISNVQLSQMSFMVRGSVIVMLPSMGWFIGLSGGIGYFLAWVMGQLALFISNVAWMLFETGDTDDLNDVKNWRYCMASMVFVIKIWIEHSVCIDCSSSFV